jgi:hypothetical protein
MLPYRKNYRVTAGNYPVITELVTFGAKSGNRVTGKVKPSRQWTFVNERLSAKAIISTRRIGNEKGTRAPTLRRHISCGNLDYTNASIVMYHALIICRAHPTSSQMLFLGTSSYLCLKYTHNSNIFSHRTMAFRFGLLHANSFRQSFSPCSENSLPGSLFWSSPYHRYRVAGVAQLL